MCTKPVDIVAVDVAEAFGPEALITLDPEPPLLNVLDDLLCRLRRVEGCDLAVKACPVIAAFEVQKLFKKPHLFIYR